MNPQHSFVGRRFGRLTVKELSSVDKWRKTKWLCLCDCGKETVVSRSHLTQGATTSCGCYRKESILLMRKKQGTLCEPGEAAKHFVLKSYKAHAKNKKRVFELKDEEFYSLCEQVCNYCRRSKINELSLPGCKGSYKYNGVDRLDSSLGYTTKNCVPCCGPCNKMKQELSPEEFIAHIRLILENYGAA